jgi:hypothetical protein
MGNFYGRSTCDKSSRSSARGRARPSRGRTGRHARVVLRLSGADDEPPVSLTPEEQAAITASKAAAARGEFATDEQVRTVWAKHGL